MKDSVFSSPSPPSHHQQSYVSPNSTPPRCFSEMLMEERIDYAQAIINKWDLDAFGHDHLLYLYGGDDRKDAKVFLEAVSSLQNAMHFYVKQSPGSEKLLRAQNLMVIAMKRLEREFYTILSANRKVLDSESVLGWSSRGSTPTRSRITDFNEDDGVSDVAMRRSGNLVSASGIAMADLKNIADSMMGSGYGKECVRIYKIIRKSIIDETLYHLGVEILSFSQIQKLEWNSLEPAMALSSETDSSHVPAFKLLLSCPSGLSPSQVSVLLDQVYDRIPHPDIILENSISEIWDCRHQQNPYMYNGLKFRYGGYSMNDGADSSQQTNVCLHLGLTDYRTFVGTNLNPLWERFLFPSEDDWRRCQHTANPLGNGAIVETSDKNIVVLQRSTTVGEFPGHFVFPGGHPEPQEVGTTSHLGDLTHPVINRKVSQEMFDSIIREVVEEIGVPAATLDNPIFIGISQRVLNVRPTAFFFIKCSLQSKEIQQLYCNAQDSYESTQLFTMTASDVESITSKMPGCHQGGFALYKLMAGGVNKNK